MKIVVLHGSPRKGNTDAIIERVKKLLTIDDSIEFNDVYLPREAPVFCHGCFSCFEQGEHFCPNANYIQPIAKHIDEADGIIIATPIYVMHITGALKAFLDHMAYRFLNHRPAYFGKKAFIITNTAGAGNANGINYLKQNLTFWGINNITTMGITLQAASLEDMNRSRRHKTEKEIDKKSAAFLRQLNSKKVEHPTFLSVILFHIARSLMLTLPKNNADRQYWDVNGWLDVNKSFYVDKTPLWYQRLAGKIAARVAFK